MVVLKASIRVVLPGNIQRCGIDCGGVQLVIKGNRRSYRTGIAVVDMSVVWGRHRRQQRGEWEKGKKENRKINFDDLHKC